MQIGKLSKYPYFQMTWSYILKTPKYSTQKLLGTINSYNKVAGYKISLQKITSFSIHQQWINWETIYGNNSIHNSLKKIKYLEVNLTKDVNDIYKENYKHLKKGIE
jgi:hypothetical protein